MGQPPLQATPLPLEVMMDLLLSPLRSGLRRNHQWSLSTIVGPLRESWRRFRIRTQRVTPEQWFLVLFVILLLAFFVVILFQPAAGRGGR